MVNNFSDFIKTIENKSNYWFDLGELLDSFYFSKNNKSNFFEIEPNWGKMKKKDIAFFAGVAEYVCDRVEGFDKPEWVYKDEYYLDTPYFSMNAKGKLRLVLLYESPEQFKDRNIFISRNSLDRV